MSRPLPDNMRRGISGVVSSLVMLADELDSRKLELEASGLRTEAFSLIVLLDNSSLNAAGFVLTADISPSEYKSRIERTAEYLQGHFSNRAKSQAEILQKSLKDNADWLEGKA